MSDPVDCPTPFISFTYFYPQNVEAIIPNGRKLDSYMLEMKYVEVSPPVVTWGPMLRFPDVFKIPVPGRCDVQHDQVHLILFF